MRSWRGSWAAAQLTGVLFSSFAWLVFAAMWPIIGLGGLVLGVCYLLGRNSRAGLRWRFGVRSASALEQRMLLAAAFTLSPRVEATSGAFCTVDLQGADPRHTERALQLRVSGFLMSCAT